MLNLFAAKPLCGDKWPPLRQFHLSGLAPKRKRCALDSQWHIVGSHVGGGVRQVGACRDVAHRTRLRDHAFWSLPACGSTMPRSYLSHASASACGNMSVDAARLAVLTAPAAHPASLVPSSLRRPPPVLRWLVPFLKRADRSAGSFQLLPGSRVGLEPTRRDSPLTSRHADSQEEPQGGLQVPVPGCVPLPHPPRPPHRRHSDTLPLALSANAMAARVVAFHTIASTTALRL